MKKVGAAQPGMLVRTRAALRALVLLTCAALAAPCFGEETRYSTWDQFFYKVQLPVRAAAPAGEVTLLVYHSYPGPLHDVGATGKSASLTITRQPADLKILDPTEIASFTFAVRRTGAADLKQVPMAVALRARELPGAKPIEVTIPLTAEAEKELWQQQAMPVGTMEVRIGGWGNRVYLLYLFPMLGLLGWVLWRRKRLGRL